MTTPLDAEIARLVHEAIQRGLWRGSDRDIQTCRHEAAHACVAVIIGASALVEVTVDDRGNGVTDNRKTPPPGGPTREERLSKLQAEHPSILRAVLSRQIVVLFAGREASLRDPVPLPAECSQPDLDEADFLAGQIGIVGHRARERFLAPLRETAANLVRDAWPMIVDLGAWLGRERTLDGPTVTGWVQHYPGYERLHSRYAPPLASPDEAPRSAPSPREPLCPSPSSGPPPAPMPKDAVNSAVPTAAAKRPEAPTAPPGP